MIVVTPEHLRAQLRGRSLASQLDRIESFRTSPTAPVEERPSVFTLASIASRIRFLSAQLAELGPQLLISWSQRGRVRCEAAFASLVGVAPLQTSSAQH